MIDEQIIKNIHTEVSKIYDYLKDLFDNCKNDVDNCFNEPNICVTISSIDGQTSRYDPIDYFKCQIANKLVGCNEILKLIRLSEEESDARKRLIFTMKYSFLLRVNKKQIFSHAKLNDMIMHYPINPEIVPETQDFYNNLMEDVI